MGELARPTAGHAGRFYGKFGANVGIIGHNGTDVVLRPLDGAEDPFAEIVVTGRLVYILDAEFVVKFVMHVHERIAVQFSNLTRGINAQQVEQIMTWMSHSGANGHVLPRTRRLNLLVMAMIRYLQRGSSLTITVLAADRAILAARLFDTQSVISG